MSAPPSLPPIPPNIAELTAPLLLGGVWNWCLYGTLVVQFYVYTYNFPTDSRFLKLFGKGLFPIVFPLAYRRYLVFSMFMIETLQTALSGWDLYYWFASGFGDMTHLASPHASAFDVPIIGAIVSLAVQLFFAYRVWLLGNKEHWWLSGIICVISTVDSAAAFGGWRLCASTGEICQRTVAQDPGDGKAIKTWLIGNTVADTLIAVSMLYYLLQLRQRDGRFSSHALISIVRLTVETNLLTTSVSMVAMVMIILHSDKNWYTCPYSNTLLVSLNNRISIRDSMASRGAVRSPAGSFPVSSARSEGTTATDIVLMDLEKHKVHSLGERDANGKIISEYN
ncbi:hypothetical protein BJY52DRAFT_1396783 [Lactarius psammicola]|nr:hypothetical protein BJY52DRAFT_1396783 [Lactarius psammicola]